MKERPAVPKTDSLLAALFASSDVVFEVESDGRVSFILGAVKATTGFEAGQIVNTKWTTIFAPPDWPLLDTLLAGLGPGERLGPLSVTLHTPDRANMAKPASLSVFRLPRREGSPISCALSAGGMSVTSGLGSRDGLIAKDRFLDLATELMKESERQGLPLRLDLVEMEDPGHGADREVGQRDAAFLRKLGGILRADSYGGFGASEVAPNKFAVIRDAGTPVGALGDRLKAILGDGVSPKVVALPLNSPSNAQNLKAIRYALDRYIEDGADAAVEGFAMFVRRTVDESARFRSLLATNGFQLVYQPVVSLAHKCVNHYEALARFGGNSGPADTIRMAEELGLISDFDLAVVGKIAAVLKTGKADLRIAANVSAVSLMQPEFVRALADATAHAPSLRPRLLIEITETKALQDLTAANNIIQYLRGIGHSICIDDFGAGAASIEYLHELDVDFVKIDGRYIQSLTAGSRNELFIKHIAALCRDMDVTTIAEMIETTQAERLAFGQGVVLGQGWLFGKPQPTPEYKTPNAAGSRKRTGVMEAWG